MMSSFNYFLLPNFSKISAFTFTLVFHLLIISPGSCLLDHLQHSTSSGLPSSTIEEKTRLGSRPPSCHNKCNQCHPCMAIQVPTIPGHHHRVQLSTTQEEQLLEESSFAGNYYKPLGWKCHCDNLFYNP